MLEHPSNEEFFSNVQSFPTQMILWLKGRQPRTVLSDKAQVTHCDEPVSPQGATVSPGTGQLDEQTDFLLVLPGRPHTTSIFSLLT